MKTESLDILEILKDLKSYPTWSTGNRYPIYSEKLDNETIIVKGYHCLLKFPRSVRVSPKLFWLMGFLNGEGTNATNKSGYLRFTLTNSNPKFMRMSFDILDETGILPKIKIPNGAIRIGRSSLHNDDILLKFWSKKLDIPQNKFYFPKKRDENKKAKHGVCHLYISNVLLRRVVDRIFEFLTENILVNKERL